MGVSKVLNLVRAVFHPLFKPTASKCQTYQMHRNSFLQILQSTARSIFQYFSPPWVPMNRKDDWSSWKKKKRKKKKKKTKMKENEEKDEEEEEEEAEEEEEEEEDERERRRRRRRRKEWRRRKKKKKKKKEEEDKKTNCRQYFYPPLTFLLLFLGDHHHGEGRRDQAGHRHPRGWPWPYRWRHAWHHQRAHRGLQGDLAAGVPLVLLVLVPVTVRALRLGHGGPVIHLQVHELPAAVGQGCRRGAWPRQAGIKEKPAGGDMLSLLIIHQVFILASDTSGFNACYGASNTYWVTVFKADSEWMHQVLTLASDTSGFNACYGASNTDWLTVFKADSERMTFALHSVFWISIEVVYSQGYLVSTQLVPHKNTWRFYNC